MERLTATKRENLLLSPITFIWCFHAFSSPPRCSCLWLLKRRNLSAFLSHFILLSREEKSSHDLMFLSLRLRIINRRKLIRIFIIRMTLVCAERRWGRSLQSRYAQSVFKRVVHYINSKFSWENVWEVRVRFQMEISSSRCLSTSLSDKTCQQLPST